jgi:DNA-binding YbaB/EbfC family protein
MKNISQLMKQAQQLQDRMAKAQEDIQNTEHLGESGSGMVQITLDGKATLKAIKIDPSIVKSDETDFLEDLIMAAFNDAKYKVDQHAAAEMAKVTGGLPLPGGMKFPF